MVPSLFHAEDVQPWRCFGKEPHTCDKSRPKWLLVSAGHLWRNGEEEFVYTALRRESAKQGRAAFM